MSGPIPRRAPKRPLPNLALVCGADAQWRARKGTAALAAAVLNVLAALPAQAQPQTQLQVKPHPTAQPQVLDVPMQPVGRFEIDRTEVTIAQFQRFVEATGYRTRAEQQGGGSTFEAGWEQRRGWTWRSPYGQPGALGEPVAHVTQPEARAFCEWAGKRLPTDAEWGEAAYVERRAAPPPGFQTGRRYTYPTGESPRGANCLGDCGPVRTVAHAQTSRGKGHAEAGSTVAGVNGLHEMGGNLWEWVEGGPGGEPRTRGGSWWYGAAQMRDDHLQTKPADTAVVYIGFRCARDRRPG